MKNKKNIANYTNQRFAPIEKDLIDIQNNLVDSVKLLLEREEILSNCEDKSNFLEIESKKYLEKSIDMVYNNRISKLIYEKILPWLKIVWGYIIFIFWFVVWLEPCKIYFENTTKKIHLKLKDEIEKI